MTGVSEFLGFLAIKIIPGHARLEHPPRRSYRGLKNDDPLLRESSSSDEGRSDDTARSVHATEHEADLLSGNTATHLLDKSSDHGIHRSALRQPDFWMLAVIMLMRKLLVFHPNMQSADVASCTSMYVFSIWAN